MARCCATLRTVGTAALGVKRPESPNCDITAPVSGCNLLPSVEVLIFVFRACCCILLRVAIECQVIYIDEAVVGNGRAS